MWNLIRTVINCPTKATKTAITSSIFTLFCLLPTYAITNDSIMASGRNLEKEYGFGLIPALAFDSDLGLKYGAVINLFDFRDKPERYSYRDYLNLRLTNTTEGTLNIHALLESHRFFNNSKVIAEAGYFIDQRMDFTGFNGAQSVYDRRFTDEGTSLYRDSRFYSFHRRLTRFRLDFHKGISDSNWSLLTGYTRNRYVIAPGGDGSASLNDLTASLYRNYEVWGLIPADEASGGVVNLFTIGMVFDSRNAQCYCTDGRWMEYVLLFSPESEGNKGFTKLITTYRQHKGFFNDLIVTSFRLSLQTRISGTIPSYFLSTVYDSRVSNDGIGGAFSLRGALRSRIISDGYFTGNIEVKYRVLKRDLLNQSLMVSLSTFYDNAMITDVYNTQTEAVPENEKVALFRSSFPKYYSTIGAGVYFIINETNAITVNYGIPTNPQSGNGGLYIGSSLLF